MLYIHHYASFYIQIHFHRTGGVDIFLVKGNGTLISGGQLDPDTLIGKDNHYTKDCF